MLAELRDVQIARGGGGSPTPSETMMTTIRTWLLALPLVTLPVTTLAVEGAKSLCLLGKRGPLAGLIPRPGWYVTNDLYHYHGHASAELPIAGSINSGVTADALVNIFQLSWTTEFQANGGRLAIGAVVPYGPWTWRQMPRRPCRAGCHWRHPRRTR